MLKEEGDLGDRFIYQPSIYLELEEFRQVEVVEEEKAGEEGEVDVSYWIFPRTTTKLHGISRVKQSRGEEVLSKGLQRFYYFNFIYINNSSSVICQLSRECLHYGDPPKKSFDKIIFKSACNFFFFF